MLNIGDKAPNFTLPDQNNKKHKLSDYQGNWVFLYFYPRDNTPGCTKEACAVRNSLADFNKLKVKVFGISADSVQSHKKFSEKFGLNFPLLSDENKKVLQDYGVWVKKNMAGRIFFGIKRMSYIIDPNGKVAKVYKTVKPNEHAAQVLRDLSGLMF